MVELEKKLYFELGKLSEHLGMLQPINYFKELIESNEIIDELEHAVADEEYFETKKFPSIFELRLYRIILYIITREFAPKVFIETGVLHGMTSHFILNAIHKNNTGKLISIDLPSYFETGPANKDNFNATLPPNKQPGWVIPNKYHERWELHIGRSVDVLPKITANHKIDIFLHDSEHTYETMVSEMKLAWNYIVPGGLLICDNLDMNTSFFDFCRWTNRMLYVLPSDISTKNSQIRFGIIKK